MSAPRIVAGHEITGYDAPGGLIVVARHWIDGSIGAVVVQTEDGDYLAIHRDDYGPIPAEIVNELAATCTVAELYERAKQLGFEEVVFRFDPA